MRLAPVRHLLAVLLLPFNVTVVIPAYIFWRAGGTFPGEAAPWGRAVQIGGAALMALGLGWFVGSLRRFASEGEGTLAPWDPPQRLVVSGLYRYVRNPMITGVALILLGEAALLLSRPQLSWALLFITVNAVVIPLHEEPRLAERFGDEYREYCRAVPRLIPRLHPWQQPTQRRETKR
jgi:protein-S-isoprenylcysteine O-methyltransferase Ste14